MMYSIPLPKLELSSQTRTLNKGTAAKIIGNCRNLSSHTVKTHTKQASTFSGYALNDAAQSIAFAADIETAKLAHESEFKNVCEALGVLRDLPAEDTSHPLVSACVQVKNQIALAKKSGADDLQALDLAETISGLEELRDSLATEAGTINNRYQKTLNANKKAFGSCVARCQDVAAVAELLKDAGSDWASMLPPSWGIKVPDIELGKATFNAASPIGGFCPDRNASVLVCQIRMATDEDARDGRNQKKAIEKKLADGVIQEIGELMKGAS